MSQGSVKSMTTESIDTDIRRGAVIGRSAWWVCGWVGAMGGVRWHGGKGVGQGGGVGGANSLPSTTTAPAVPRGRHSIKLSAKRVLRYFVLEHRLTPYV